MIIDDKHNMLNIPVKYLKDDQGHAEKASINKNNRNSLVLFAGDSSLHTKTNANKNLQAHKKAMKTIMDQFKKELKTDQAITDLLDKKKESQIKAEKAILEIKNLRDLKNDLKSTYGITDDSSEQKNLDLLEKSILKPEQLSSDDLEQLKNIGPLTDYQKEAIKYDSMELVWKQRVQEAGSVITGVDQAVIGINLEKLKTHPMTDAQKQAADIMEAASKEVINTLINEAKDNEKEKLDEIVDNAKKQKEETEKQETIKEEPTVTLVLNQEETDHLLLLNEVKQYADKQILSDEEIKGIVIDEQV